MNNFFRGRRLRQSANLRALVQEVPALSASKLIMPYFVVDTEDANFQKEISSMPGQYQFSLPSFLKHIAKYVALGLKACILFGIPSQKDEKASAAFAEHGIIQQTIRALKERFPELLVITDVCLCEYMSHGHCGILLPSGEVANDATLEILANTALSHAKAGADIVAPSDMMDGRISKIRQILDQNGFSNTPILSYAVKYASAFYGPFREAAESAPKCGDRKSYQMNPRNIREALLEAEADSLEGADAIMVKPAGPYLDIIRLVAEHSNLPLCAYQVSGEYSMIKAAAQNAWIDEKQVILESLWAINRAGAQFTISYFTEYLLENQLLVD